MHLVPSGICWPGVTGIIGNGVVVNPGVLLGEIAGLREQGIDTDQLFVSDRAHVIMPYHILLDELQEKARGRGAIGTTGQGIGPAYIDKVSRDGIRVGDLLDTTEQLPDRVQAAVEMKNRVITGVYGGEPMDADEILELCRQWGEQLRPRVRPTEQMVQDLLEQGKRVLLEGAQGTLLDVDHGSYPYVTSSSPSIGGAITGLGLDPQSIKGVLGVFKAYSTRVGGGPMPTEMHGQAGEDLREKAHEYGTTTGRARRVGWFDAVAARYSRQINGFTGMVLTRLDILDGMPDVKICVGLSGGRQGSGPLSGQHLTSGTMRTGIRKNARVDGTHSQRDADGTAAGQRPGIRAANRGSGGLRCSNYFYRSEQRGNHSDRPNHPVAHLTFS